MEALPRGVILWTPGCSTGGPRTSVRLLMGRRGVLSSPLWGWAHGAAKAEHVERGRAEDEKLHLKKSPPCQPGASPKSGAVTAAVPEFRAASPPFPQRRHCMRSEGAPRLRWVG